MTALHYAAGEGRYDIALVLMDRGAEIDAVDMVCMESNYEIICSAYVYTYIRQLMEFNNTFSYLFDRGVGLLSIGQERKVKWTSCLSFLEEAQRLTIESRHETQVSTNLI